MSNPVAGDAMALRCASVIRGISKPLFDPFTSSNADASGVVVPIPALPEEGKVFCALLFYSALHQAKKHGNFEYFFHDKFWFFQIQKCY
jgi:hypothetical protein